MVVQSSTAYAKDMVAEANHDAAQNDEEVL